MSCKVIGCLTLNNNNNITFNLDLQETSAMTNTCAAMFCSALLCLFTFDASAADPPAFRAEIFKTGTLVYSDEFDGELNREY